MLGYGCFEADIAALVMLGSVGEMHGFSPEGVLSGNINCFSY